MKKILFLVVIAYSYISLGMESEKNGDDIKNNNNLLQSALEAQAPREMIKFLLPNINSYENYYATLCTMQNCFITLSRMENQTYIQKTHPILISHYSKQFEIAQDLLNNLKKEFKRLSTYNSNGNSNIFCLNCHQPASQQCSRCKERYCSSTCQKADWPIHKKNCQKKD